MSRTDDVLDGLRGQARSTIAENALAFGRGPASVRIALGPIEKAGLLATLRTTGADKRIDRTLDQITGGEFSPQERRSLEDRVLDEIKGREAYGLRGIVEGPPVDLRRDQKAIIDSVMGRLGDDPLASKARGAYGRAVKSGQIRTR
jgi:hypothetical protein